MALVRHALRPGQTLAPIVNTHLHSDHCGGYVALQSEFGAGILITDHGAPFTDVAAALERARSRLARFRADPASHARHCIKALAQYHLLEVGSQPLADLRDWFERTLIVRQV